MKEFMFDVKLWTSLRVSADTPTDARKILRSAINGAQVNFGVWPDGSPIIAEVSTEGTLDIVEVNGDAI